MSIPWEKQFSFIRLFFFFLPGITPGSLSLTTVILVISYISVVTFLYFASFSLCYYTWIPLLCFLATKVWPIHILVILSRKGNFNTIMLVKKMDAWNPSLGEGLWTCLINISNSYPGAKPGTHHKDNALSFLKFYYAVQVIKLTQFLGAAQVLKVMLVIEDIQVLETTLNIEVSQLVKAI